MAFPYFQVLVVNSVNNPCPCCEKVNDIHIHSWDLHNTEKSNWLKNLESIMFKNPFSNSKGKDKVKKIIDSASQEQLKELQLWDGSEAELESIQYYLEAVKDEFQEGFTAMLLNSTWSQCYWSDEWDNTVEPIRDFYIGDLDSDISNWKDLLKDEKEA